MKSKRTAPLSAVMLRATACASEKGCVDYVSNSERGPAPWADMQKRLEKQRLAHAEGKEGQKPPCTLPLTAACYQGDHVPCTNADAILHLLTSSISFSSLSTHPHSLHKQFVFLLQISHPSSQTDLSFPRASANMPLFCKPQFFQY